ncbi:MAG: hypothetical protein H6R18_1049 [Proteobacteria bacterium]|nr:hypothetical protein [Pseudomonadota bacterium]
MPPKSLFLLCFGAFLLLGQNATAQTGSELANALWRDSEITLHLRSHYLRRDRSWQEGSLAWAGGGWLAYRSAPMWNTLRLGLTAYSSQKLYAPADKDGAALLLAGQHSYSVLGEAYTALIHQEQQVTIGRFLVNQYEVNPQDTRMTPRTFHGLSLSGKVSGIDYYIARLDKMKSRNWDYFQNVATVAGAPAGLHEPLYLISLHGKAAENLELGFASYRLRNLLTSSHAEAAWLTPIATATKLRLGGQYFRQGSTGAHLLTGSPFSTWTAGFKTEVLHGSFSLAAIFMKTGEGAAYRMPFGSWPGYASRIINNFNRAGERVRAVDASFDATAIGLPGFQLNGSITLGDHAINATTGAGLARNREDNLTADYRFSAGHWPQWVKPLSLRARLARFSQKSDHQRLVTDEYHFIVKYTTDFK